MTDSTVLIPVQIYVSSYEQLCAVYALLGGASPVAVAAAAPVPNVKPSAAALPTVEATEEIIPSTLTAASPSDDRIDADGHPFDPALHTGTITKAGLWRMKAGVSRPDPKPGFPIGTAESGTEAPAGPSATIEPAASTDGEDDEFAAFRNAAAKADAEDANAVAAVPARKWTDADLGALCNQAATKLGDPAPVKAIIADFIPEGVVAHSRNIPEDKRADFAAAVEAKAGIEFAG